MNKAGERQASSGNCSSDAEKELVEYGSFYRSQEEWLLAWHRRHSPTPHRGRCDHRAPSREAIASVLKKHSVRVLKHASCQDKCRCIANDLLALMGEEKKVEPCCKWYNILFDDTGNVNFMHKNGKGGCAGISIDKFKFCPICGTPRPE